MKLYYPKQLYIAGNRGYMFPLLKPFLKANTFTDEERIELYGVSEKDYFFTESIEAADKVILPMSWNYYLKTKTTQKAIAVIDKAKRLKKEVWIVMVDDFGMAFPKYDHCIVFRSSGYCSKLPNNHIGIPSFVNDPLKEIYGTTNLFNRPYTEFPTVGFCGLANNSTWYVLKEWLKIGYRNLKYNLGLSYIEKEQLVSPSYLRYRCLKKLKKNSLIISNFIIRKKYRAGALNKQKLQKSTIEFFDNIKNSDYVLCVRGAGNFSVRLYETLAMGRIPIFLNTDCMLPLANSIDWKRHVVWVEYSERYDIAKKVINFHKDLNTNKLNELFKSNRLLWEDKLRLNTFFKLNV